jgi:glycosyltransferase involved in cell wall biosynthesis
MRVLNVYRTYYPDTQGGLEEVIRQICRNTRPFGVESRVLSLSRSPSPQVIEGDGSTVYRARLSFELASCGFSWEAVRLYRDLAAWADVIHLHYPWPFADVLHFVGRAGKPTLLTYHSDIVRQRLLGTMYAPLRRLFLGSVDRIVCTSPNYLATSDVLPTYAHKLDIVPIGLDEASYPMADEDSIRQAREEYGSDFFLFVGVLRYYKGLHILLDAVKDAPYSVLIAGSGPTEGELKRQAERLGLDNVRFLGHVSDRTKVALFQLCRGVVFPSYLRSEAFGVTLLEGAMYARPLISTEIGSGTSHVNVDKETGFVVAPGSSAALRGAMDRLHADPDLAQRLGAQARRRFHRHFTGELMGQRYVENYRRLLGEPRVTTLAASRPDSEAELDLTAALEPAPTRRAPLRRYSSG